jgi:predicted ArsR family transcriptional regulator
MNTKQAILKFLRRDAATINELAERLGMTRNAIIVPIRQLEAEATIYSRERRGSGAGKPPLEYHVQTGLEDINSQAYKPFMQSMIKSLPDHLSKETIKLIMHKIGNDLAEQVPVDEKASLADRLAAATDFLDDVGAETTTEYTDTGAVIRSYSCPLGGIVRQESCSCHAVERFFANVTGADVQEECARGESLICKFIVTDVHQR